MITSRRAFVGGVGTLAWAACGPGARADEPPPAGLADGLIYLNTGSLGPTPRPVLDRVLEVWRTLELNPVVNSYGEGAALASAEAVRAGAAGLIGCPADQLLITNGTTDALNAVAGSVRLTAGDAILTTDQEHHGGLAGWTWRARRDGGRIDHVPVRPRENDAAAIVARFAAAIRPETRIIAVSHVLFSTGLRMPVRELAALARSRGLLCVVDGAQAVGAMPIDVGAINCHAYAASGHKWLMGPKGTGFLFVSPDAAGLIDPVRWEMGRGYVAESSGMGPLPLVAGLGAAIEAAQAAGLAGIERRILALRDSMWHALSAVPGVSMASPPPGPLASGLLSVRLPDGIEARPLLVRMRERFGVVARAIPGEWFNGLRFSTHIFNTEAEIDAAVAALRSELGAGGAS
jgi:selenocysteine lyase/cysteine desulfurase